MLRLPCGIGLPSERPPSGASRGMNGSEMLVQAEDWSAR